MKCYESYRSVPYKQGVTGSTPVIPTRENQSLTEVRLFCFTKLAPEFAPIFFLKNN